MKDHLLKIAEHADKNVTNEWKEQMSKLLNQHLAMVDHHLRPEENRLRELLLEYRQHIDNANEVLHSRTPHSGDELREKVLDYLESAGKLHFEIDRELRRLKKEERHL